MVVDTTVAITAVVVVPVDVAAAHLMAAGAAISAEGVAALAMASVTALVMDMATAIVTAALAVPEVPVAQAAQANSTSAICSLRSRTTSPTSCPTSSRDRPPAAA